MFVVIVESRKLNEVARDGEPLEIDMLVNPNLGVFPARYSLATNHL